MPPSRWLAALGVAALLAAFVAVTLRPVPITISRQATHSCTTPDREASIQRFSRILQFQTIASIQAHRHVRDESEVLRLQEFLANSYKAAYAHLDQQKVLDLSLLLKWPGQNQGLDPAIFISHTDVVPVGDESAWKHGPFSGAVADGYVWGRGAQDVKVTIMQMLEAVSLLISEGFEPERTAYLAFGHDEETKGTGALATAELLASQGVKPVVILDEGGALLTDGIKGVTDIPTAVVAVAEKGYLSLELAIRGEGGHSSMPEYGQPNVVSLAAGFLRVFHKHPPPIKVVDPVPGTFRALAFGMHVPLLRWLLSRAHIWPWRPLLGLILSRSKSAEIAALVRTTAAVVDIRTTPAGDNVLPDTIYISFNFRTLPGEDLSWPEAYLRRLARRAGVPAEALSIRLTAVDNASSVTEASGPYFQAIHIALQETLAPTKGLLVAPNLLNGKTDSAHYLQVFPGTPVLRFTPVPTNMSAGDLKGIHGVNERCSINGFLAGICFYKQAMRRLLS